ncbi:MAG TPA: hypothetical protein VF797_08895 [Noviherbaspirillum sp.]
MPTGDESSVKGYMGKDGKCCKFYARLVETTAGHPVNPIPAPTAMGVCGDLTFSQATIDKLDIRGGCTFPRTAQADRSGTQPSGPGHGRQDIGHHHHLGQSEQPVNPDQ